MVDRERFVIGATDLTRSYVPSRRRQVQSATDAQSSYGYDYDDVGLPKAYSKNGATSYASETDDSLQVGTVTYGFDGLHRTISRTDALAPADGLELSYGPDGQVATATRGGAVFSYIHDEGGQRLLKSRAGVPVAAYLDEGYLEESGLTERISVGGRTVGVLKNGVFQTVATDLRGTVLAETTGVPRLASPFGQRDVHTGLSAALEYVEKGYDADLGLVRMGARDYDPETGRFTTPDPLFLETVEKCLEKPKQANLFGYAQGDPLGFGDPSGLEGFSLSRGLSAVGSFISGVGGGISEALTGSTSPLNDSSSRDYQLGRAAGLFVTGTAQLISGIAMVTSGGAGVAGGGGASATGVGAVVGVPAMVASAAVVSAGVAVTGVGAANVKQSMDVFMAAKNGEKTFQTYTKTNPKTGEVHSGRTSGTGTPDENVAARDKNHHTNERGFGPAELDKSSTSREAIRGREQQLIDANGGAKSQDGTSGNAINGISEKNENRQCYLDAATKEFGPTGQSTQ